MTESYLPQLFKFSGAGNDFVVLDGRQGGVDAYREPGRIGQLCRQYRTDGLMILTQAPGADFGMEFYNPDGSGGMMCGNGGRCIVAFAQYLGIEPSEGSLYRFVAPDGPHEACILDHKGDRWTVRLKMIDVHGITSVKGGYFLNTGTRHFVKFVPSVDSLDMEQEARPLRWDPAFQPEGTNVNLVEDAGGQLRVRTFEKGVEGETLACGTGLTASAIAAYVHGIAGTGSGSGFRYRLQCRRGDFLEVEFTPEGPETFTQVYLTGPAELEPVAGNQLTPSELS